MRKLLISLAFCTIRLSILSVSSWYHHTLNKIYLEASTLHFVCIPEFFKTVLCVNLWIQSKNTSFWANPNQNLLLELAITSRKSQSCGLDSSGIRLLYFSKLFWYVIVGIESMHSYISKRRISVEWDYMGLQHTACLFI